VGTEAGGERRRSRILARIFWKCRRGEEAKALIAASCSKGDTVTGEEPERLPFISGDVKRLAASTPFGFDAANEEKAAPGPEGGAAAARLSASVGIALLAASRAETEEGGQE
jgi:hypothetical protein